MLTVGVRWRFWLAEVSVFGHMLVGFPRQSAKRGGTLRQTGDFQMERDWPDRFGRVRPNIGYSEPGMSVGNAIHGSRGLGCWA